MQKKATENILTQDQQNMRAQVVDLELKARYWKAMYDVRLYTLQATELETDYNTLVQKQREQSEKQFEELQTELEKLRATEGVAVEEAEDAR